MLLKPFYSPKPKRLPEAKRMTIAAGFRCSGGVVFGADTEESFGDMRLRVHKIPVLSDIPGKSTTVITGACDNGHAMDAFVERIFDAMIAKAPKNNREVEELLRGVTLKLYAEDFRVYPSDAINVSLLVAVKLQSEQRVEAWSIRSSIVRRMHDKEILGVGGLAQHVLDYLYVPRMPLDEGLLVMAQLLTFAKKRVLSVGGDSYLSSLHDDGSMHEENLTFSPGREGLLDYFLSHSRRLLLATGKKSVTPDQYDEVVKEFVSQLKWYREYGIS
jgi:hypothetical protein